MLQNLGQLAVLNRIFNLRKNEWPRVWLAWGMRFFYRLSFVLGWTVLITMFVGKYGIAMLPYLFLLIAIFTMIGTFFYSTFIDRFSRYQIMIVTLVLAGMMLFFSSFFAVANGVLFFSLIIVTIGVFLSQFKIALHAFIEDLFSPLESERAFPVIEAADTIAGIIAGLIVVIFASSIAISSFIYLWMGFLFLIIPILVFSDHLNESILNSPRVDVKKVASIGLVTKLKHSLAHPRYAAFIKGLFLIVFFQWLIYNLMEFQYTKAVYRNVSNVVLDAGSGFEHAFVYDLGVLFILFSASALFIQLFVGSRIIDYLGIVGTMIVHVLLTLLSLLGLTFYYNFPTAVLAKNNFTVGTVLFTSAYNSSYYAMTGDFREHIREIIEGIVRPVGALIGTFALIILQKFFSDSSLIFYVNLLMVIATFSLFYILCMQQKKYTNLAVSDLLYGKDKDSRMTAIDILAQKGHKDVLPVLRKILFSSKEPVSIKLKVLRSLSEINSVTSLGDLFLCLKSKDSAIRTTALDSLARFSFLSRNDNQYLLYKKCQLVTLLKDLHRKEENPEIVNKIINLMAKLSDVATMEFLFGVLKTAKGRHRAEVILAFRNYESAEVFSRLEPFLRIASSAQQINAAIVLYKSLKYKSEVLDLVSKFLASDAPIKIGYGIFAIGELKLKNKRKICHNYLYSENKELRIQSAVALAKLGSYDGIPVIVELLLSGNKDVVSEIKNLLRNVDVRILKNIDRIVAELVNNEVDALIHKNEDRPVGKWHRGSLMRLSLLYELVGDYERVEDLKVYLK